MRRKPVTVSVLDDQEAVAGKIAKYNLLAVPVLEKDGSVVGFVTVDDVVDVLIEEGTEDVLKMAAVEAGALDRPYFETPVTSVIRQRVGWLLFLFVAETLTGTVLRHFEAEIAEVVALSFFIPLLIGTGGNAGSQTVMTIIRSLALGEIRLKDARRVLVRELLTGVSLGLLVGGGRPRPRPRHRGAGCPGAHRGRDHARRLRLGHDGRRARPDPRAARRARPRRALRAHHRHPRGRDRPRHLLHDRQGRPAASERPPAGRLSTLRAPGACARAQAPAGVIALTARRAVRV